MLRLTLDALHTIDVIARSGSFTAAAAQLHKVPSTISYTVNKLEEQLGVRFFERNGPHVELTPLGRELLEEGRCLLTAAEDLQLRLQRLAKGVEIELSIVLDELLPVAAFADDIRAFQAGNHSTRLRFGRQVMTGVWESLMQGRADLVIAAGAGPSGGGYKTQAVGTLSFAFCVAAHHPLVQAAQPLHKDQLLRHHAIVIADSASTLPTRSVGLMTGQRQLTVAGLRDKIALQKAGLGHGFLPRECVADDLRSGALVELEVVEPKPDETFYLAWRVDSEGEALKWWRQRLSRDLLPQALLV